MTEPIGHVTAFAIDALAIGALDPEEERRTRAHLASCAPCRREHEVAAELRDQFERDVFARTRPSPSRRSLWLWLAAPALTAAGVLLLLLIAEHRDPEIGIKGDAAWQVFANRDGETFAVHDGTKLVTMDRVRFVVTPNGAPYVLIASIDSSGAASIYYPYHGEHSGRVAGNRVELPGSIVLDSTVGPERLFVLFTDEPVSADLVTQRLRAIGARGNEAIRSTARLDVTARAQLSIVFEKVTP